MTQADYMNGTAQMSAADWVARLSGEPMEADWLGFEAWLQAAPGHRAAYDKAMTLWLEMDQQAAPLAAALADMDLDGDRPRGRAKSFSGRRPPLWMSGTLMSVAAAVVTLSALHPFGAKSVVYATGKGERRDVVLQDGTHVALNANSKMSVKLQRNRREVTLDQGEAAFQVTHDAARPFQVQAGDQTLSDIGTEFNVLRANGDVTVTVREGMVEVSNQGHPVSLGPGSQLQHHEGAAKSVITLVSADDAFGWRSGRLIYRNRPLSEIAADLNRYGESRVRLDGPASSMRFSGVLTIDDQQQMVRRLAALLPLSETRQDGVITLHGVDSTR
jgi:transmembrane sensor